MHARGCQRRAARDTLTGSASPFGYRQTRSVSGAVGGPRGAQVALYRRPVARRIRGTVAIWHDGRCVAHHERCYGGQQEILDLEHYRDVLAHRPAALAGSKPLAQWRALSRWSACYNRCWEGLLARQGRRAGTAAMIALVQPGRTHGHPKLRAARWVSKSIRPCTRALARARYFATIVASTILSQRERRGLAETVRSYRRSC